MESPIGSELVVSLALIQNVMTVCGITLKRIGLDRPRLPVSGYHVEIFVEIDRQSYESGQKVLSIEFLIET